MELLTRSRRQGESTPAAKLTTSEPTTAACCACLQRGAAGCSVECFPAPAWFGEQGRGADEFAGLIDA